MQTEMEFSGQLYHARQLCDCNQRKNGYGLRSGMSMLSIPAVDCAPVSLADGDRRDACRLCGFQGSLQNLGGLPEMYRFAGTALNAPLAGGSLIKCPNCFSMQRHPIFAEETYNALYRRGTEAVWATTTLRYDQQMVLAMINRQGSIRSVLDVGCNTGTFLQELPTHIERYGVEPSIAAASVAQKRGINVISDNIDKIGDDKLFDCITFIDVIEHVPYPTDILLIAAQHLEENGCLIISTGNPESNAWTALFRNKFWYCSFAEHISFPSKSYFKQTLNKSGLNLAEYDVFRYSHYGLIKSSIKFALQVLYFISPRLNALASWVRFREFSNPFSKKNAFLPCAGIFTDHHIVRLTKHNNKKPVES